MGTYVMFLGFTQQGIANIKDTPERIAEAKKTCESFGIKVKEFYAMMGTNTCDTIFIINAQDHHAVAKAALTPGMQGDVHTNSYPAFTEEEFKKLMVDISQASR